MTQKDKTPPIGVRLTVGIDEVEQVRETVYVARVRWTDPTTGRRDGIKRTHRTRDLAEDWVDGMRQTSTTGIDPGQTLSTYMASIGDRWTRAIDVSSTFDPYSAGLRLRVTPALGHLPVNMITAGLIDRAIDQWEKNYGRSTVKNTVAGLVLVLDEAVRDGIIARNPAKDRARRKTVGKRSVAETETNPRDLALPDVATLDRLVSAVTTTGRHECWGDMVTLLATTAMRISEVSGLRVSDVDLDQGILRVQRQTYPGRGGLITKATKGRRRRVVPIIDALRPTLERLTHGRADDARLVRGPREGVITTATLRDATDWDATVSKLGLTGLVRHGLRHTALTWMADAGVELHLLQRVAGHQDPAVTARYLHPDQQAILDAGTAFSTWWAKTGPRSETLTVVRGGRETA